MMDTQHFSYHTHTNFSDGANSPEEMIEQAMKIGYTELGISDHLIVHKNIQSSLSWPFWYKRGNYHIYNNSFRKILPAYQKHCDELRKLNKAKQFKVYIGFEVDFFTYDGWFDELKEFLKQLDYDYIISGNHMLFDERCEQLFDLNDLPILYPDSKCQEEFLQRHFKTMNKAVKSGVFKFLAHLDYARKLGDEICSTDKFIKEEERVLDSLAEQKMAMEISTKGLRKINDFYPCDKLLAKAKQKDIEFVVSDDAHSVSELGKQFDLAEKALLKHNITKRLKF